MKFITIAVVALSLGVVSGASPQQTPAQDQTVAPAQPAQRVMPAPGPAMSLAGCLYREWDAPALIPNTAQTPEVLEGYVVAYARIVGQGSSAPGRVGGTGGRTYRVEGIPVAQLRALLGKRVEIAGRLETDEEDGFVASSIREVAGGTACSPKPAVIPIPPR